MNRLLNLVAPSALCLLVACGGSDGDSPTSGSPETDANVSEEVVETPEPGAAPEMVAAPDGGAGPGASTAACAIDPATGVEGEGAEPDLSVPPTWCLDGRYLYEGDFAGSSSFVSGSDPGVGNVVMFTIVQPPANGAWSGSTLSFSHSLDGNGTYAVLNTEDFLASIRNSPGSPVVQLTVEAGRDSAEGNGAGLNVTRWRAVGGTVTMVVDDDGDYHLFTVEPLSVVAEVGDAVNGIPGRPDTTTLAVDNVHVTTRLP